MELDEDKKKKALVEAKNLSDKFDEKEAEEFIDKHKDKKWYSDFILLYDMITDKEYKLDTKTYLVIAGALAYVVLPTDVIPDFIPIVGYIDDAFVLTYVINSLKDEIERYKKFKNLEL